MSYLKEIGYLRRVKQNLAKTKWHRTVLCYQHTVHRDVYFYLAQKKHTRTWIYGFYFAWDKRRKAQEECIFLEEAYQKLDEFSSSEGRWFKIYMRYI